MTNIKCDIMIITCCNQKGGAGKTTLILLLALALESVGKSVAITDNDPQETITRAIETLKKYDLTNIGLIDDPTETDADIVFVDTPPSLNKTVEAAIQASDSIILVTSPSPADLWSTQDTQVYVKRIMPKSSKVRILFNNVLQSAKISRDLSKRADAIGLQSLENVVVRRQNYQYAFLQGWTVLSLAERDEIKTVALEIVTL